MRPSPSDATNRCAWLGVLELSTPFLFPHLPQNLKKGKKNLRKGKSNLKKGNSNLRKGNFRDEESKSRRDKETIFKNSVIFRTIVQL